MTTFRLHGVEYGTGLLKGEHTTRFAAYAANGPMLTRQQIVEVIETPTRVSGRKKFGPQWIKNQGNLGACNGFAGSSALERARVRRGLPVVRLSGFGLYSAINGGRDQGSMLDDGMEWITEKGCPPTSPDEQATYRWERVPEFSKREMSNYKAHECYHLTSELELASALASGFDCVIAVHASDRWMQLDDEGVSLESNGVGNHAVLVDDVVVLKSGEFGFDMANSWDLRFGNQGRSYQTWKRHLRSTVENHYFYAIRSTSDGREKPPEIKG